MKRGHRHRLAAVLLAVLGAGSAGADDLPSVTALNCGSNCQSATDPKPLAKHSAYYPGFTPDDFPTEGLVVLRATVTKDGSLKDQKVVRVIGAQVFADKALEASMDWKYQPAMRNGVAVDRPNWEIMTTFRYSNVTGARDEVYHLFHHAAELSNTGKHAEAIAVLLPILSKPHLNFYERESICLLLAIDTARQGDYLSAREYLDDIITIGDSFLGLSQRKTLWRVAAAADVQTGQLADAQAAFRKLNAIEPVAADDPLIRAMQAVEGTLRRPDPLVATARIAKNGVLPQWSHVLARRSFAILNVSGKLNRLTIECGEHLIESEVSDKAEWHVPASWAECRLNVFGEPGTTFSLVELTE